jgi:rod shape-determining protein MreB
MSNNFFNKFRQELGIDLGTANTLIYVKDRGVVINEPSVVAINTRTEQILAVGGEAKEMLGKTPPHIEVTRPLSHGIISDYEVTEKMLRYFIEKIHEEYPSILPSNIEARLLSHSDVWEITGTITEMFG